MTAFAPVIEQHAEEACFLWLLRSRAVRAPHYRIGRLARLDSRLEGHVDGLRIAGDAGWELARAELAWREPGEIFAAAVLAFESGLGDRIEEVLSAALELPELLPGVVSALGWLELKPARPWIEWLAANPDPVRSRLGLRAAAIHRWNASHLFDRALASREPSLIAAAARAAGELGDLRLLGDCRMHVRDAEEEPRFWTAWSLALSGDPEAVAVLREVAESESPHAARALDLAARASTRFEVRTWHERLCASGRARSAVELVGRHGDPEWVPWLIEQMSLPELARAAGESFSSITGIDLALEDLEGECPEGFEAGPTEDAASEDVALDPDENLAWPDPVLVQKWWSQHHRELAPGVRHLLGRPLTEESLRRALRQGFQRQRAGAALELARLLPGTPLFEVRAPGFRQRRLLGAA